MWVEEENNQDPYGRTNPTAGTPTVGAGGGVASAPTTQAGTSGTTSNPSTQNPTQSNAPTQTFGTVQDYLKGNQQQGEALGQQFTGNLASNQTNEKSAIDTAAKQTQSDINSGTTNYDAGLVNQAVSDPTKITGNPDQLSSFLKQWNAAYTGPSSFEASTNYAPAQAASSEAQNFGTEESTTGGQQQILHDQFGVYGQGNQGLDQAVLQNSSYFPKVQQQASDFQTIPTYLSNAAAPLDTAATNAAANTAAAQTQTRQAFANMPTSFQSQINAEVAAKRSQDQATASNYQAALASGDAQKVNQALTEMAPGNANGSISQYLGALNQSYGVNPDLTNYYTFNPATDVTAANVATPQEYAKAAAYQQLTGQDYSGILNPANAAQAGTTASPNSGVNVANLTSYLKNTVGQQDKELLGKGTLADVSTKLNLAPITDPKNMGDTTLASKTASELIGAAQRAGMSRGTNGTPSNLENIYHDAATSLVHTAGGGTLNTNSPATAGLLQFVRQLGTYLYGKPQY